VLPPPLPNPPNALEFWVPEGRDVEEAGRWEAEGLWLVDGERLGWV